MVCWDSQRRVDEILWLRLWTHGSEVLEIRRGYGHSLKWLQPQMATAPNGRSPNWLPPQYVYLGLEEHASKGWIAPEFALRVLRISKE